MKVAVGSVNPVKVAAVRAAFEAVWPNQEWAVEPLETESGVPDQPLSESETLRGARNRAYSAKLQTDADFSVGLEGGLTWAAGHWMECGWIIVLDQKKREGLASTARMQVPTKIHLLLEKGLDLTEALEELTGVAELGKKQGFFGFMTNNAVDRFSAYRDAVAFALARFAQPQLFEGG